MLEYLFVLFVANAPAPVPMALSTCERLLAQTRLPAECQKVNTSGPGKPNKLRLQQLKAGKLV